MSKKKKQQPQPPTLHAFLLCYPMCDEGTQQEYLQVLQTQKRPETLCGETVPQNLNGLSYGQLDDMRGVTEKDDAPTKLAQIIFGKYLNLYEEDVNKVFGFVNFCTEELKRINNIFASIKTVHSSEEIAAGVEKLNFGSFGILDWYAKRMGITNQNDVRNIAWVRIFQCMKNDHEQQMYEKRLNEVYMRRSKAPSGGGKHRKRR